VLQANLDCPMSSSLKLVQLVDNKLWTRIKMAECGIGYPETLAFAYRSSMTYAAKLHSITVIHLLLKDGVEGLVRDEIERFIYLPEMEFTDRVGGSLTNIIIMTLINEFHYHSYSLEWFSCILSTLFFQ